MKKNYKFAIRPYNVTFVWMVLLFLIFEVIFAVVFGIPNLLIIILPIAYIAFAIYSLAWGWNSRIYFNDQKVYRKIGGKTYEWYYEDMIDVEFKYEYRISTIAIKSAKYEKPLIFNYTKFTVKKFCEACTNTEIKYKLLYLIDK